MINLVQELICEAYVSRASDVHFHPQNNDIRVRYRVDGVLRDAHFCPRQMQSGIISRIKILAGLRTDEHQAAQDGRFRLNLSTGQPVDVRVSVAPTYYGENAVLRLLGDKAEDFGLGSLGFSEGNLLKIQNALRRPHGLILITGPTGSGKTTTLYTLIKQLNTKEAAIITVEDPIEYAISGIEQIQVNPKTGLTFANGLRSILRQDPNIIMVGEISDSDTAALAVNTALTGHLVLSTLHTNDAASTLPRMLDMKVEPYLLSSTLSLVIGQRLARKICENCKTKTQISKAALASLRKTLPMETAGDFYKGAGCGACGQSGYLGRLGIHEVLPPDAAIRGALLEKASAERVSGLARQAGMAVLAEDGLAKAAAGLTTLEEVLRISYD